MVGEALKRHQILDAQIGVLPGIDRQGQVRIRLAAAMPREMLAGGGHAGALHAVHVGLGQCGHHLRIAVEGAVADDRAHTPVQVEHRREAEIDVHGAQLGRHQPAGGLGQAQGTLGILLVDLAETPAGWQPCETLAEALHPPPLVVHGHQQARMTQGMNLLDQRGNLFRRFVVSRKQDQPARQRVAQAFAVLGRQRLALDVEHDRTERHGQARMVTGVPAGTRSNSSTMSRLHILMQPREPGIPIGSSSGQPWI